MATPFKIFKITFIDDFQYSPFLFLSKRFVHIIFYGAKTTNCKDEKINHSDIYLVLIYSGAINVFRKLMQLMFFKEISIMELMFFKEISIFNRLLINKISCFKSKWFQRRSETWTARNLCSIIFTIHVLI